jgi:hypothetical protein
VRQPGPTRAFCQRVRVAARPPDRGRRAARKLACLFWCLLTREEDYAFAQPSPTRKTLRRLELTAGAGCGRGIKTGLWATNPAMRHAERDLARQAEADYQRTVREWDAAHAARRGASDTWARAKEALEGRSRAADHEPWTSALR